MYSYGPAMGARGGGLLRTLANLIPALSSMPWQLSLHWQPGAGLTASLLPGVGAMGAAPGGFFPGALATPFFPGAFYGAAAPYAQGAAFAPMGAYPGAISPMAVSPYGPTAVSPLGYGAFAGPMVAGVSPYMQSAVGPYLAGAYGPSATVSTAGLGWGPFGPAGAYLPGASYASAGAMPYPGAAGNPDLAYAPYGGLQ